MSFAKLSRTYKLNIEEKLIFVSNVFRLDPAQKYNLETNGSHLIMVIHKDHQLGFSVLRDKQTQTYRLYYIFVWYGEPSFESQHFLEFIFWNYNILNAVTITQTTAEQEHRTLTYNPFRGETIQIAADAYTKSELFIEKDRNLFGYPMQITRYQSNLNKYRPLNGTKSVRLNVDNFVPYAVVQVMNATLNLTTPYLYHTDLIQIATADLLVNGRYYGHKACRRLQIEPTIGLKHDDICVLVPYKRWRPMLESIYRTLEPSVWICAIVAALTVAINLTFILKMERRRLRHRTHRRNQQKIRLDLFGNLMKLPGEFAPRLIVAIWLLHYVIISSLFQSALYQGVTREGRDPQITSMSDLIDSKYDIVIDEAFYNGYLDVINKSSLKGNFKVVSIPKYLNGIYSKNLKYAYVERLKRTKHFANIISKNNLPVYYTMRPCVRPQIETYYVRRGSPLLSRIDWILRLSQENGLFAYWEKRLHAPFTKVPKLFHRANSGYLENLYFIFEYFLFALLACLLAFIVELISWHWGRMLITRR